MLKHLVDKIIFGALLITCLQLPLIADQYLQFLSGFHQATLQQAQMYESNAKQHGYPNAQAMINELLSNTNAAIRTDANQKLTTLIALEEQEQGLVILKNGNFFERIGYMLFPSRYDNLKTVLTNYKLGLPLAPLDFAYSALLAMIFSQILWFISFFTIKALKATIKDTNQKTEA